MGASGEKVDGQAVCLGGDEGGKGERGGWEKEVCKGSSHVIVSTCKSGLCLISAVQSRTVNPLLH